MNTPRPSTLDRLASATTSISGRCATRSTVPPDFATLPCRITAVRACKSRSDHCSAIASPGRQPVRNMNRAKVPRCGPACAQNASTHSSVAGSLVLLSPLKRLILIAGHSSDSAQKLMTALVGMTASRLRLTPLQFG